MRRHPRVLPVAEAEAMIARAVTQAVSAHDVTFGELVGILARVLESKARTMVRVERHGGPTVPGDTVDG